MRDKLAREVTDRCYERSLTINEVDFECSRSLQIIRAIGRECNQIAMELLVGKGRDDPCLLLTKFQRHKGV